MIRFLAQWEERTVLVLKGKEKSRTIMVVYTFAQNLRRTYTNYRFYDNRCKNHNLVYRIALRTTMYKYCIGRY